MTDPPARTVAEHWPFVGRDSDLEHALAQLRGPGAAGLAIHGPPGVGRSRFTSELMAELASPNGEPAWEVLRAIASSSSETIPFGAISHLLPLETLTVGVAGVDPLQVLGRARAAIVDRSPVVLAIDDAHLLDALSLTLLQQLVQEDAVRLVVTVRSGEHEPDGLAALARTGRLGRVDLSPLGEARATELLELGLGGPVDGRTARRFTDAAAGVPLMLRELVRTAVQHGSLSQVDGLWRLDGALPSAARAVELVAARLDSLPEEGREVLELLVLAGETPLDLLDEHVDPMLLERLEAEGLIAVRPGGSGSAGAAPGQLTVVVTRHAVADAVRAMTTPLRTRRILRAHADRYEGWSGGRPEDEMRVAGWRLDAGLPADGDTLEQAATLARHAEDYESARRFAEAADRAVGSLRTTVLRGDALYELGRWEECEEVFVAGVDRPGNPFDRLRMISVRSTNLLFGLMRADDALALTRAALAQIDEGDTAWTDGVDEEMLAGIRTEIVSRIANLQMYGGDPASALRTLGEPPPVVAGPDDDLRVRDSLRSRVLWAIPGVPAIALAGRTGEAVRIGFDAFAEHGRLGGEVGFSSLGVHLVTLSLALQEHGDLDQARSVATAGYEATLESGALLGQVWFAANLGRIALITGHPATTYRWGREVLATTASAGWMGPRLMTLTGMAGASALLGDLASAGTWLDEADTLEGRFRFLFPERAIGRAWVAAADGRLDDARALLASAADDAAGSGHLTAESWLRYEIVRLGGPRRGITAHAERLAALSAASDSGLLAARAGAAAAFVSGAAAALEAAAVVWEEMGADLPAAELYTAAAEAERAGGSPRTAQAFARRGSDALDRTGGARSFRPTSIGAVVPLSPREREIAALAAAGVPSKEIATRLYLSVRTVNNHLQNAYTKLGVSSRADVARLLAEG